MHRATTQRDVSVAAIDALLERLLSEIATRKLVPRWNAFKPEPPKKEKGLDYATRQKIEKLFGDAAKDRAKAFGLKRELDKLGVFKQYEDRFLDLFERP